MRRRSGALSLHVSDCVIRSVCPRAVMVTATDRTYRHRMSHTFLEPVNFQNIWRGLRPNPIENFNWFWFLRPTGVKSLVRANEYTAGCPRYLGRTSSYMEFGEVRPPEADATVGPPGPGQQSRYLKVRYEESGDPRRPMRFGELTKISKGMWVNWMTLEERCICIFSKELSIWECSGWGFRMCCKSQFSDLFRIRRIDSLMKSLKAKVQRCILSVEWFASRGALHQCHSGRTLSKGTNS